MYQIGVSSGLWGIARPLELLGWTRKMSQVTTLGTNFIQVDVETISEFKEPNLIDIIKKMIDELGIKWSLHGEISGDVAWDTAWDVYWYRSQRRLHEYLDGLYELFIKTNNEKYKPLYINFHISIMTSLVAYAERWRRLGLTALTIEGEKDWGKWLEEKGTNDFKKWFKEYALPLIYRSEIRAVFPTEEVEEEEGSDIERWIKRRIRRKRITERIKRWEREFLEKEKREPDPIEIENQLRKIEREERRRSIEKEEIYEDLYNEWLETTKGMVEIGRGGIVSEEIAYAIVAKYLESKKDDPLEPYWKVFFGEKSLEDLEKEWNKKLLDPESGQIYLDPEIVAMVSIRYIIGHLLKEPPKDYLSEKKAEIKEWEEFYELDALKKMEKIGIYWTFENPEVEAGAPPGMQRIIRAKHMYNFAKIVEEIAKIKGIKNYVKIWVDPNHWQHNKIDTKEELEKAPQDFGSYVLGVHIYNPSPYHEHVAPIELGSELQKTVYEYFYILRKKGFKEGVIIIEIPAFVAGKMPAETYRSTMMAIRNITNELEKETNPDELPPEFYGLETQQLYSFEKQLEIIRHHVMEPVKGTLIVPEEEFTFLGRAATEKPGVTPEKWKREELK